MINASPWHIEKANQKAQHRRDMKLYNSRAPKRKEAKKDMAYNEAELKDITKQQTRLTAVREKVEAGRPKLSEIAKTGGVQQRLDKRVKADAVLELIGEIERKLQTRRGDLRKSIQINLRILSEEPPKIPLGRGLTKADFGM